MVVDRGQADLVNGFILLVVTGLIGIVGIFIITEFSLKLNANGPLNGQDGDIATAMVPILTLGGATIVILLVRVFK